MTAIIIALAALNVFGFIGWWFATLHVRLWKDDRDWWMERARKAQAEADANWHKWFDAVRHEDAENDKIRHDAESAAPQAQKGNK